MIVRAMVELIPRNGGDYQKIFMRYWGNILFAVDKKKNKTSVSLTTKSFFETYMDDLYG